MTVYEATAMTAYEANAMSGISSGPPGGRPLLVVAGMSTTGPRGVPLAELGPIPSPAAASTSPTSFILHVHMRMHGYVLEARACTSLQASPAACSSSSSSSSSNRGHRQSGNSPNPKTRMIPKALNPVVLPPPISGEKSEQVYRCSAGREKREHAERVTALGFGFEYTVH